MIADFLNGSGINRDGKETKSIISHASEDKERFVLKFAKDLRSRGVDAGLDEWELLPGDKLVTKIFEIGLKSSDAVIIVLSEISVKKPWYKRNSILL